MDSAAIGAVAICLWMVELGTLVRKFVLILYSQFAILLFGGGVPIGVLVVDPRPGPPPPFVWGRARVAPPLLWGASPPNALPTLRIRVSSPSQVDTSIFADQNAKAKDVPGVPRDPPGGAIGVGTRSGPKSACSPNVLKK